MLFINFPFDKSQDTIIRVPLYLQMTGGFSAMDEKEETGEEEESYSRC